MTNPINASIHLAGQVAKVGMFAAVHRLGASYARRQAADATDVREARERENRSTASTPSRNDILEALRDLITSDAALVNDGICAPMSDLPNSLPQTAIRLREMFADIPKSAERSAAEDRQEVRNEIDTSDLPEYYTQNFHYQTGGYLTSDSARLYDLQVETLFSGTAGAMRRQALRPIADIVAGRDQRHMNLLDVACGTGRLMKQISQAFPALPQTGIDLSDAYLDEARSHLRGRRDINLQNANAEHLPFEDGEFDIVTCCFLFHELPAPVRRTVIAEMSRVLAPGGTLIFIDSMQLGDAPQFDGMLEAFPERFHEPYYRNYLTDDLETASTTLAWFDPVNGMPSCPKSWCAAASVPEKKDDVTMQIDTRPTVDAPDDDPHIWLEKSTAKTQSPWVDEQNARTLDAFADARFEMDRDALLAIYDAPDKIPYISRRGKYIYNFWKDANQPRGVWRRTTLDAFLTQSPDWSILLDVDALATDENEDWIWQGATTFPGTHDIAMLRLSRGGGDAVVLREFNLETKSFVTNGFQLPESKGGVEWLDRDTLLLTSSLGEGMATSSGYARTVRKWSRGTEWMAAKTLFETDANDMIAFSSIDRSPGHEHIWYVTKPGFFDYDYWIGDPDGPNQKIDVPSHVSLNSDGDWVAARGREPWDFMGTTHAADTVVAFRLSEFLAGAATSHVLFEPDARRICRYIIWANGKLILPVLDNLKTRYEVHTPGDDGWTRKVLTNLPEVGVIDAGRLDMEDTESNGDLMINMQDPLTPSSLALLTEQDIASGNAPTILKSAPHHFRTDGLTITQHEAISTDGERIPYTQVGPSETDGNTPVHMSGYGGFGLPRLANYNASIGKTWLEDGGISVTAHIRGGGEFGTPWHEAGRGAGKVLSHDDFAAVAKDLVDRGVTRPGRIAAEGGSNGGILISNMLVRYPERFGALFCTIPLIDMRRYSKLLAGASWIAEYGDPDKPEDWEHLKTYSAYHTAEAGKAYPPILIATARRDDRVHPGHARKMTKKLQLMEYDAWFYEPAAGGHGYGKDNSEQAAFVALGYNFLRQKIGWTE